MSLSVLELLCKCYADMPVVELRVQEDGVPYGAQGMDNFAVYEGGPVTTAAHVSFDAPDRGSVDAFFEQAIAQEAKPRGEPGRWIQYSDRYYAAYIYDMDGNNVEAVWHAPASVEDVGVRSIAPQISAVVRICPGVLGLELWSRESLW